MSLRIRLATIAIICIAAALSMRATMTPLCDLCGTWLLMDRIDTNAAGKVLNEPSLGSDPLGMLVYDAAGNVSAQLMKRNRAEAATTPMNIQGSNNSAASNGYDAYFGTYEVNTKTHTVTHHLKAAIAIGDVGQSLTRSYEIVGQELHVTFDTTNSGVPVRRTVRWRKAT